MNFTPDQVIAKYVELRDRRNDISQRHKEELDPVSKQLEILEAWLLQFLNETKQESARTDAGTAYKTVTTSATVDKDGGWSKLLSHVIERPFYRAMSSIEDGQSESAALKTFLTSSELELLNHAVNKSAVKEILEAGGALPPGVKFSQFVTVGVRRS